MRQRCGPKTCGWGGPLLNVVSRIVQMGATVGYSQETCIYVVEQGGLNPSTYYVVWFPCITYILVAAGERTRQERRQGILPTKHEVRHGGKCIWISYLYYHVLHRIGHRTSGVVLILYLSFLY